MLMMLPFEAPTIFEGIHKSYFRMPQVVKDQRGKFENDDLFRQLSHESAIKYTGFKDRPLEERQMKFITNCHEGHTEISVVQSGNQFTLMFNPAANPAYNNEGCDFDKEHGKVHIKAGFILNGVCVMWRGWIDVARLEGFGCLEFDEYRAYVEDTILKQQIDKQTCNNTSNNHQQSPLSHLNNHLALGAVHSAANSLPPVGLNTSCLGPPPPSGVLGGPPQPAPPPPVSLADSAAHYGNAAIAAAAAAAFHQALSVGGPPPPQALHRLGVGPTSAVAVAAAAAATAANGQPPPPPPLLPGSGQHLSYTNGTNGSSTINIPGSVINSASRGSPPNVGQHHHHLHNTANNNTTATATTTNHNHNHSSERDQNHHHRRSTKRSHEELTHIDDVDVVSDIHSQDLDFPPRRIFKSEPLTTAALHHHRATRRA